MTMSRSDTRTWAKEEILGAIDAHISELDLGASPPDFDEREALQAQRDRVAKFLGFQVDE